MYENKQVPLLYCACVCEFVRALYSTVERTLTHTQTHTLGTIAKKKSIYIGVHRFIRD